MPVRVWKHWRRKFSVSRTSIPEGGGGREEDVVDWEELGERGFRRVEIACILGGVSLGGNGGGKERGGQWGNGVWESVPVKGSC